MGSTVTGYAFARTGYHRGLDQLRRSGWKGAGPVPWSHEPNQGFLRALGALHAGRGGDRRGRRGAALPGVPGRRRPGRRHGPRPGPLMRLPTGGANGPFGR